jgi:hypothetical protein
MEPAKPLRVVTPTLDGDVLARLALADAAFTPGELRRLIPDASVDGVRRVLNRLADQGIVTRRPVGPAITYRLNRDHLAAGPITALASLRATVVSRLEDLVADWETPTPFAAVFGSWARNTAAAGSDLDLFVIRPNGADDDTWEAQIAALESAATQWTGNDARALVLAEDQVRARPDQPVLNAVLNEGVAIAGNPAWLQAALSKVAS